MGVTAQQQRKQLLVCFSILVVTVPPSEILSDNGSHFVNELIKEFLTLVGVDHKLTVAYSKEENSMVERANKEVNRHIRHICFDRRTKDNWKQTLPIAQ